MIKQIEFKLRSSTCLFDEVIFALLRARPLGDRIEALGLDKTGQLERRTARALEAALPVADELRSRTFK